MREKHGLFASLTCPDQRSNPQPFGLRDDISINWATPARAGLDFHPLVHVKCFFMRLLICVSLMSNDVEHHFTWLLDFYIPSLGKYLFKVFCYFHLSHLSLLISCKYSIYVLDANSLPDIWFLIFLSFCWLIFHVIDNVHWYTKVFQILVKSNLSFFVYLHVRIIFKQELLNIYKTDTCFLSKHIVLVITFRYMIYLELIFFNCLRF